jgi:DNA-binding HxlR family transcriptional regulator
MAIPTWLSTSDASESPSLRTAEIEGVSETLDVLANPIRLEILATLHRRTGDVRYADLRADLSIRDKGRLNYHLRQLDGLVARDDGRYALTDRGRRLVRHVASEDAWNDP